MLPNEEQITLTTLMAFPSMPEQLQYFYILEAKFINVFKMSELAVNFEIYSVRFILVIEF